MVTHLISCAEINTRSLQAYRLIDKKKEKQKCETQLDNFKPKPSVKVTNGFDHFAIRRPQLGMSLISGSADSARRLKSHLPHSTQKLGQNPWIFALFFSTKDVS